MIFTKKLNIAGLLLLLFWSSQLIGQSGSNPFELQHRTDKKAKTSSDNDLEQLPAEADLENENPFHVIRTAPKPKTPAISPKVEPAAEKQSSEDSIANDKNFLFSLTLTMLILLTLLLSIYRAQLGRAYRAFSNENVLRMLHREKGTVAYFPYYVLYFLFIFNLGIYIFLLLRHYNLVSEISNLRLLLMTIGGAAGLFFLKHTAINILGWVFPIQKEASIYNMTITVFGIVLSVILFVANVLIAYAPPQIIPYIIYISFFIIGSIYFFRSIRGLSIASSFLNRNKFHFFIYLCTVEIAPVLILWKLATNGIGIQ